VNGKNTVHALVWCRSRISSIPLANFFEEDSWLVRRHSSVIKHIKNPPYCLWRAQLYPWIMTSSENAQKKMTNSPQLRKQKIRTASQQGKHRRRQSSW